MMMAVEKNVIKLQPIYGDPVGPLKQELFRGGFIIPACAQGPWIALLGVFKDPTQISDHRAGSEVTQLLQFLFSFF